MEEAIILESKEQVVAKATELARGEEIPTKSDMDQLKQLFYRFHNQAMQEARKKYIDEGGDPEAYVPVMDPDEETFRQAMQVLRERRADEQLRIEKERADNLEKKLHILERIQQLTTNPEEAGQHFDEYKSLQQEWKETGAVPAERSTELWKNYQLYSEQYYDLLKMGHELRDYDFKKNLELKTALCEKAEALKDVEDVISAFNMLQGYHQEWKEIGPVNREIRESLWQRFKDASTEVNKRHQAHFEALKAKEEENLQKKTELCEKVEAVMAELGEKPKWEELTQTVMNMQAEWREIGYAPQKLNTAIFERFREACNKFFNAKSDYYKNIRASLEENLQKKRALLERAVALKDSVEWNKTAEELTELQKQWKEIGAVPKKYSQQIWNEFRQACDSFFQARKAAGADTRNEQQQNLQAKKDIIQQLQALAEDGKEVVIDAVKELQQKWNEIGYVPFKEKDKIYNAYQEVCDKLYESARSSRMAASAAVRVQRIKEAAGNDSQRLQRAYEQLKAEIKTYENNLGFLSASSKKGNALVDMLEKKVQALKSELKEMEARMRAE
ncbi:MAG: DUF349 domain-containing protein [Bacteroidaceae bacterium]|nr:DUF349 domain-containing protein [Bacteroidaceae bacterium]